MTCLGHEEHTATFVDSSNLLDGVDESGSTVIDVLEVGGLAGF